MNDIEMTKQLVEQNFTLRYLAGLGFMLIAIVAELFFTATVACSGYSDGAAIGIGTSYAVAALASIVGAFSFVQSIVPGRPIKVLLICLIGPLVIQFYFMSKFVFFIGDLPFRMIRSFKRRTPKSRRKANVPRPKRLEKLVPLHVGDTVTFTPPNEAPVIGVVRRINTKSTTVVSQTGETWRVPHNQSDRIVRSKAAPLKPRNVRQLELVR